jgi:hypothetical protein
LIKFLPENREPCVIVTNLEYRPISTDSAM